MPGGSLPVNDTNDQNLAAYMASYGGETEAMERKHLRRTGSEPSIAPRMSNMPGVRSYYQTVKQSMLTRIGNS